MLKDLFSNRLFIGALVFFVLMVVSGTLYLRRIERQGQIELERTQERHKQWQARQQQTPKVPEGDTAQGGHFHTDGMWHAEGHDQIGDVDTTVTKTPADVLISPYGFGPYPENPAAWKKWGPIPWESMSRSQELMTRVQVKLLNQGLPVKGAIMDRGLVYPTIKGVVYVEWEWSGFPPRRYISEYLCTKQDDDRLRTIKEALDRSLTAADVPSDIELKPLDKAGIDPYTFLGLP